MSVEECFRRPECTLLKGMAHHWRSANSDVTSCPAVSVGALFGSSFIGAVGASLVSIAGQSGEALHYHSSHLLGAVVRGAGYLCVRDRRNPQQVRREPVTVGDCVVIPRGVLHLFECEPNGSLDYIALEVSTEPIDYQKHFPPLAID